MWIDYTASETCSRMTKHGMGGEITPEEINYPDFASEREWRKKVPEEVRLAWFDLTWGERYAIIYLLTRP